MTEKVLIEKTDAAISDLVYDKFELLKAYNYYYGKRNSELFKYLEDNFGIGNPTSVEFTPLLKKHIDALVGEYLGTPILPKISCKDSSTISHITEEKKIEINKAIIGFLKQHLNNSLIALIDKKPITDTSIKLQLDKIIEDLDLTFVSQYEIAAQNVIQYIMQSRETDFITKVRQLITDTLISGENYFQAGSSPSKTNVKIETLDPLNTFIERNPESPYVKDSPRGVIRHWYTSDQIISKYGRDLTKEEISKLKEKCTGDVNSYYGYTNSNVISGQSNVDILPGHPCNEQGYENNNFIPVYEVEWIETDSDFVMNRYRTVRIGHDIYILYGKDEEVIRSKDNPSYCGLSINGVHFLNRNSQPYSLILKCASLQDRYDLLIYYRDNLIANSGTSGNIMDMSLLPTNLGVNFPERVQKWLAYRKQGTLWIDTSQEGRNDNGNAPINTIFNGFDDTIKVLAVQAIELAIQSVEQTVSSITGVFRERLNGIEQKDAVTNIKQGVTNSFIVTKHYLLQMDLVVCEILSQCLNRAKIVYKNGLSGTLILGDKFLKIFTALPEHFTLTDYDIHIIASSEIMEDLQTIKTMIPEFVKSQALTPDIIFEALTTKSLSDLKYKVQKAMKLQKQENNLIMLLSQLLEETSLQLKQTQSELQKSQQEIKSLDERRIKLEQEKIQLDYQVAWFKAQTEKQYKDRQMDVEEKRTEIEIALLRDGNPYNNQIKNLGL